MGHPGSCGGGFLNHPRFSRAALDSKLPSSATQERFLAPWGPEDSAHVGGLERGRFLSTYNGSCEHLLAQEAAVAGMPWASDIKPLLGTQRYHYKRRWGHRTERRLVPQLLEY